MQRLRPGEQLCDAALLALPPAEALEAVSRGQLAGQVSVVHTPDLGLSTGLSGHQTRVVLANTGVRGTQPPAPDGEAPAEERGGERQAHR